MFASRRPATPLRKRAKKTQAEESRCGGSEELLVIVVRNLPPRVESPRAGKGGHPAPPRGEGVDQRQRPREETVTVTRGAQHGAVPQQVLDPPKFPPQQWRSPRRLTVPTSPSAGGRPAAGRPRGGVRGRGAAGGGSGSLGAGSWTSSRTARPPPPGRRAPARRPAAAVAGIRIRDRARVARRAQGRVAGRPPRGGQ